MELSSRSHPSAAPNPMIEDGPIEATESSLVTIDQICSEVMKIHPSTNQKARIGRSLAQEYRRLFPNAECQKIAKYCNGEMRDVNAYPRSFTPNIIAEVRRSLSQKVLLSQTQNLEDCDEMGATSDENDIQ